MIEKYNKLVRDRIPEIIKSRGKIPVTHTAPIEEYKSRLNEKLFEEVREYTLSGNVEELADLLEVVYAICELNNVSRQELIEFQRKKSEEKGKFLDRIVLDEVKD
jgi:predicted house-cleaning noncanonical NTP pyrophosphatase (MazG superfamily)